MPHHAHITHHLINAMEITSADVILATKRVSMGISFAERSLKLDASVMTKGVALCQEFSEHVESGARILELDDCSIREIEEIKCSLSRDFFTALTERMVEIGYCCSQVQKDPHQDKCVAWFEPATPD